MWTAGKPSLHKGTEMWAAVVLDDVRDSKIDDIDAPTEPKEMGELRAKKSMENKQLPHFGRKRKNCYILMVSEIS